MTNKIDFRKNKKSSLKISLLLILFIQFNLAFAQVDSVSFYFVPDHSKEKYDLRDVGRTNLPSRLVMLNCQHNDTLGVAHIKKNILDTVVIMLQKVELIDCNYDIESSCEYKYDIRNGIQKEYYDFESVQGVCIKANPFLKLKGKWKKGLKHGKWIYYNTDGTVQKIEKYRKDKLLN